MAASRVSPTDGPTGHSKPTLEETLNALLDAEADQLCQRVAILDRGEIVALDTPAHLKLALGGKQATLEDVFVNLTGRGLSEVAQ